MCVVTVSVCLGTNLRNVYLNIAVLLSFENNIMVLINSCLLKIEIHCLEEL